MSTLHEIRERFIAWDSALTPEDREHLRQEALHHAEEPHGTFRYETGAAPQPPTVAELIQRQGRLF